MTPAAPRIFAVNESVAAYRAPFHVLAVGKCKAVQPLLERIINSGPPMELHTCLPDGAGFGALHGQVLDLIFVDADSPHYVASALCHAFKDNIETRAVPLIVVSANAKACEKAVAQGADDFATPQTLPALLLKRIEALVHVRRARQLLGLADEREHEPQFPPVEWRGRVSSENPLPHIKFDGGTVVCKPAVVLFADLRGYTHMCECLGPTEVALLLKEYFSMIRQITLEHQGEVFNTAGDCLMAGFDLSDATSDAATRALHAAQMMMSRFATLAGGWLTRFHMTVGLGVGINMGEVAIAPLGFSLSTDSTLVGDTVNVAARLCQRARAGEIVLSGSLKKCLGDKGDDFSIAPLLQAAVRGRIKPVDIFCLPLEHRLASLDLGPITVADVKRRQGGYDVPNEPNIAAVEAGIGPTQDSFDASPSREEDNGAGWSDDAPGFALLNTAPLH